MSEVFEGYDGQYYELSDNLSCKCTAASAFDAGRRNEKRELEADADRMMREYRAQAVDVLCPRELSAKMLKRNKINLNEISHQTATGLIDRVLKMGVLLTKPNGYVLF
ncbi:hypothetical protein K1719_025582 [Acacia pycnantha]|nr:hypothetical protein K1719_025582 [Acacia pycnantha]